MHFEKAQHPGAPFVLFGHSMGSFLAQEFILRHAAEVHAVVLSATSGKPPAIAALGRYIARLERLRVGPRGQSGLLKTLSFDAFNKPFKKSGPTDFEWLTRDRAHVEKYVADPLCGFGLSTALWVDLLDLFSNASKRQRQAQLPKALPVYTFTGSEDPGNERASGMRQLVQSLHAVGLTDVTARIWEGGRHEMLNETNRDEVVRELLAWLEARVPARS
jgi:alpha-beta hydrolase superfamily lysophospholipase